MTARNHQPAFTPPVPSPCIWTAGRINAFDCFDFVPGEGLVGYDVVELVGWGLRWRRCWGWKLFVGDGDVAFRLPHGEGWVRYMPCPGEPGGCWGCEWGLREVGGIWWAEGDRVYHGWIYRKLCSRLRADTRTIAKSIGAFSLARGCFPADRMLPRDDQALFTPTQPWREI